MEIHSLDHVLTSKALVLKNSAIGILTSLSMTLFSTLSVALYRRRRSDLLLEVSLSKESSLSDFLCVHRYTSRETPRTEVLWRYF